MAVLPVKLPSERSIRLTAGLIMFTYATCHLISHATGLFLLDSIERIGHDIILAPWRTPFGLSLLLAAFLTHLGLGLWALYRRRHLRMPAIEAWQLGLGLTIPLLLAPHVTDARLGVLFYGLEDSYFRVLYVFWVLDPLTNLSRQLALLIAVWTHGCIGIHMWLRYRPWYRRHVRWFAAAAIAVPVLAILGVINAGWDTVLRSAVVPGFSAAHSPSPAQGAAVAWLTFRLQLVYLALLAGVLVLRALRNAHERHTKGVEIDYRAVRRVTVPRGFSILEASRWAAIPHASVCGGRGRCTTCRVRVWRGLEHLAPPAPFELAALKRVGASSGIRLACQVRPTADVSVTPLLPAIQPAGGWQLEIDAAREQTITALHTDLRELGTACRWAPAIRRAVHRRSLRAGDQFRHSDQWWPHYKRRRRRYYERVRRAYKRNGRCPAGARGGGGHMAQHRSDQYRTRRRHPIAAAFRHRRPQWARRARRARTARSAVASVSR